MNLRLRSRVILLISSLFVLSCFIGISGWHKTDLFTGSIIQPHYSEKRIAIFVQGFGLGDPLIWDDIFQCIENLGKAKTLNENLFNYSWVNVKSPKTFKFDVFITHGPDQDFPSLRSKLEAAGPDQVFGQLVTINEGMDIKQFLYQLLYAKTIHNSSDVHYDSFLKIHSKSRTSWRRGLLGPMCGSPAVAFSSLQSLWHGDAGVIVPQGFLIQRSRGSEALFSDLRNYVANDTEKCFVRNIENMKLLYRNMYNEDLNDKADFVFSAGTMFWARYQDFRVPDWLSILPWMSSRWSGEYQDDGLMEHAMERLFVSIPYLKNVTIGVIGFDEKPIEYLRPHF